MSSRGIILFHLCLCFLMCDHIASLAQSSSRPSNTPKDDANTRYILSCSELGRACNSSIEKHVLINDEKTVLVKSVELDELVTSEETNYKKASIDLRQLKATVQTTGHATRSYKSIPRLVFIGEQAGAPSPVVSAMAVLEPIYAHLKSELTIRQMPGLADYVSSVHSSVLVEAAADPGLFVVHALQKTDLMFSTLRQTRYTLSVSPTVISLPTGATFKLQTQQDIEKGVVTIPIISTAGQLINLYRGLYTFTVSMNALVTGIGTLNLIDYPGTAIVCKLGDGSPNSSTTCEAK